MSQAFLTALLALSSRAGAFARWLLLRRRCKVQRRRRDTSWRCQSESHPALPVFRATADLPHPCRWPPSFASATVSLLGFHTGNSSLTLFRTVPEHFSSPLLQLAAKDSSIELVSCPSELRRDSPNWIPLTLFLLHLSAFLPFSYPPLLLLTPRLLPLTPPRRHRTDHVRPQGRRDRPLHRLDRGSHRWYRQKDGRLQNCRDLRYLVSSSFLRS